MHSEGRRVDESGGLRRMLMRLLLMLAIDTEDVVAPA